MERVVWDQKPKLRTPTLVCSFKGWNDAAESASSALRFLETQWDAGRIGAIDPEEFFDFQVTRPTVRLTDGLTREIEWPEFVLSSAQLAAAKSDVVFLIGNEPNLRWKTFAATVVGAARELDVAQVVSLGALLADVPHTRPVQVTGIAGDASMAERLGFSQTRYEGPTGIVGVLHDACARDGLESASLWAPVPHYVAAVPSPKASLALIDRIQSLMGVTIELGGLEEAALEYERRLDEAVAAEPEVRALVERLEQQLDESEISFGDLPSGDSIAREFQRFLRDQGPGPGESK
jgi:predicted ATP-grasp superfamily ATP-dependent carboligase